MVDQKLDPYAQKSGLGKEIQCCGDKGDRERAQQKGKDFHQYGDKRHNGQGKPCKPLPGSGIKGDHIQIKAHGDSIEEQRDIDGKLGIDHGRKDQHEQKQTCADDKKGP